jgi:hypothetical protein
MKTLDLKIPTSWNKLTRKQLLFLCSLYMQDLTVIKFKVLVFLRFTGVKALPRKIINGQLFHFFRYKKDRFSLTTDEVHSLLQHVNFLTSESELTNNLIPEFRVFHKRFFGPSNSCYNISVHEFLFTERMLEAFHETKEIKHLRSLCAILYRPQCKKYQPASPDYNGDRRETFNDFTFEQRARWFKFIRPQKLFAVYIFYMGCRKKIIGQHPFLFNNNSVSSEKTNHIQNMKNLLIALNQGDITKNKKILQSQVWEAFGQLNETAKHLKPKK